MSDLTSVERERILAKSALFNPPEATLPDGRRELVGLSREELVAELGALGEKPFRAKQLWHWIYHQGTRDFASMSSIAKPMQAKLAERFTIGRPDVTTEQTSTTSKSHATHAHTTARSTLRLAVHLLLRVATVALLAVALLRTRAGS